MQLQIKAVGTELTDTVHTYVTQKIGGLNRFIDTNHRDSVLADIHVSYFPNNTTTSQQQCAVTISGLGGGTSFHVTGEAEEMHVAIDRAAQKLEEQLRRHHDKQTDRLRSDATAAKEAMHTTPNFPPDDQTASEEGTR